MVPYIADGWYPQKTFPKLRNCSFSHQWNPSLMRQRSFQDNASSEYPWWLQMLPFLLEDCQFHKFIGHSTWSHLQVPAYDFTSDGMRIIRGHYSSGLVWWQKTNLYSATRTRCVIQKRNRLEVKKYKYDKQTIQKRSRNQGWTWLLVNELLKATLCKKQRSFGTPWFTLVHDRKSKLQNYMRFCMLHAILR